MTYRLKMTITGTRTGTPSSMRGQGAIVSLEQAKELARSWLVDTHAQGREREVQILDEDTDTVVGQWRIPPPLYTEFEVGVAVGPETGPTEELIGEWRASLQSHIEELQERIDEITADLYEEQHVFERVEGMIHDNEFDEARGYIRRLDTEWREKFEHMLDGFFDG
jgi:hypothetical protein